MRLSSEFQPDHDADADNQAKQPGVDKQSDQARPCLIRQGIFGGAGECNQAIVEKLVGGLQVVIGGIRGTFVANCLVIGGLQVGQLFLRFGQCPAVGLLQRRDLLGVARHGGLSAGGPGQLGIPLSAQGLKLRVDCRTDIRLGRQTLQLTLFGAE